MRKPMIYVAGPISTGGDILGNTRRGIQVGEQIRRGGFVPFIPHLSVYQEILTGTVSWEEWLTYDEEIILRCDGVFRMEGASKGADREVEFAKRHGIPVFQTLGAMELWRDTGNWTAWSVEMAEKLALDGLQREIGIWGDATFGQSTPASVLAHLRKEIAELVESEKSEEIADCVMLLIHFAHKKAVSIRDAVREKFEICKKRKWGKPDAEGVVEHVRE